MRGLRTAIRTLTILPIPGQEASDSTDSLPFFPLVGAVIGLLAWGASLLVSAAIWPGGGGVLALIALVVLTRGLHLDGLADVADSSGGWDRQQRLRIMKDTRLGAFGGIALVLVLLSKWAALTRMVEAGTMVWVVVACAAARSAQVELIVRLPYARVEDGTAGPLVKNALPKQRTQARGIVLAITAVCCGPMGLVTLVIALLLATLYGTWCLRTFGGVTGDLLGAGNELVETVLLILCAMPGENLLYRTGWTWLF